MLKFLLGVGAVAGDVVVLGEADFEKHVQENQKVLVKFYAPWCGHCKKMAPEFEGAATALKERDPAVSLADVDATQHPTLAQKYSVSGYPTIKWFVNGEPKEYTGGRTKDKIIEWVDEMNKAAVIEGPPLEPTNKPVIVLRASTKAEWFDKFADGARQEGAFFFVNDAANTVTMQHQGEDVQTLKEPDEAKLKTFFDENKMPMVGELNGDTFENYTKSDKGLIWFLFKHAEGQLQEAKKDNLDLMLKVARHEHVHGKLSVTFTDTIQFAQAVEGMLGVTEFPAVVIQKKAGGKQKFQFENVGPAGELDADKIVAYIKDVMDEKIKPKLKSEPKPAEQGDVKVVVGETLLEMVFDEKKDVLFEVYAPWCGHCKKLEPEYEMLAKKVTKDADDLITIAKMDGTANDSPTDDIDWSGFPTMKYIKAGSKVVESYEGGRTAKDMWAWIRENSTHKDEITKRLADKYADESKHDEL